MMKSTPLGVGGGLGRGNGGSVRHCSCLGTLGVKEAIIGGAFVVCAMMKSTPLGVGGGLGRGNGGSVRHCSCLGTSGTKGAIIGGAFVLCSYFGWEPTPWGEGAWVWVRAAAPAVLGGLAAIRRPTRTAGATDCAQGWGGGGTMRQKGISLIPGWAQGGGL